MRGLRPHLGANHQDGVRPHGCHRENPATDLRGLDARFPRAHSQVETLMTERQPSQGRRDVCWNRSEAVHLAQVTASRCTASGSLATLTRQCRRAGRRTSRRADGATVLLRHATSDNARHPIQRQPTTRGLSRPRNIRFPSITHAAVDHEKLEIQSMFVRRSLLRSTNPRSRRPGRVPAIWIGQDITLSVLNSGTR